MFTRLRIWLFNWLFADFAQEINIRLNDLCQKIENHHVGYLESQLTLKETERRHVELVEAIRWLKSESGDHNWQL